LGCRVSPCYGLFSFGAHFETHEPFISLNFQFYFSGCGKPWIAETTNTESVDMGARLHSVMTTGYYLQTNFETSFQLIFNSPLHNTIVKLQTNATTKAFQFQPLCDLQGATEKF
jgi:hypothetical protein